MAPRFHCQALFLHDRLIAGALDPSERAGLAEEIKRRKEISHLDHVAVAGALEEVVARLLGGVRELGVAVLAGDLGSGELVTLTQDFYIRRDSDERGSF